MHGIALHPFWYYYGGKWRSTPTYPRPRFDTIIEPFAGAAGYSLHYYHKRIFLLEKYAVVVNIWKYLISAKASEIMSIPLVEDVRELPDWVPQEAKWLVGFVLGNALTAPRVTLSAGLRKKNARALAGWTSKRRELVASQVDLIRHWKVIEGEYSNAPDIEATWFIDPPYQKSGVYYKHSSSALDYNKLAQWCKTRRGQVTVCEAAGAKWLPFVPHRVVQSFGHDGKWLKHAETIWTSDLPQWTLKIGIST